MKTRDIRARARSEINAKTVDAQRNVYDCNREVHRALIHSSLGVADPPILDVLYLAKLQARLPVETRQQLLDAIYNGKPFRESLRDLGLTSNQVWGLTKTDEEWSTALEAALTATRRDSLRHGTNAGYVAGCVCQECREHQRQRMTTNC